MLFLTIIIRQPGTGHSRKGDRHFHLDKMLRNRQDEWRCSKQSHKEKALSQVKVPRQGRNGPNVKA